MHKLHCNSACPALISGATQPRLHDRITLVPFTTNSWVSALDAWTHDHVIMWQDRVRELESEIEWVRAERQDAQQAAQREQKQAQARIKEAEDAASRAKAARRSATYSQLCSLSFYTNASSFVSCGLLPPALCNV